MADTSTLILHNANVLVCDAAFTRAEAVAIANGRIVAVGSNRQLEELSGRRIDMSGRTIAPGFNDCHMHVLPFGLDLITTADLSPAAGVNSVPDLIAALKAWAAANPTRPWVLGARYNQNLFPGARHPTRQELDAAFPDRPVYVLQTSRHGGVANSVALKLAGITRDTPDPQGGNFERDGAGELTGLVCETAQDAIRRAIPEPDRATRVAAIRRACEVLAATGITSASDLNTGLAEIDEYRAAVQQGVALRLTLFPRAIHFPAPDKITPREQFAREHRAGKSDAVDGCQNYDLVPATGARGGLRLGPVKLFSDGALTLRTAAMREPYIDGSGTGTLIHAPEVLKAYVACAHRGGWQIAIHAIGDRATELCLDAFAEANRAHARSNCRHRIEHAMVLDGELIQRFIDQQVLPVVQPEFISSLGTAYELGLGAARAARLNPNATLQRRGIGVAFSSDCPIVPGQPLSGIRAAVLRRAPSGRVLGPEECITPFDALRNYTHWAAYSSFDELQCGTLEPGKRADLVVLSGRCENSIESWTDTRVVATLVGGECVHGEL